MITDFSAQENALIEAYLGGTITPQEREGLKNALAQNKELAEYLRLRKQLQYIGSHEKLVSAGLLMQRDLANTPEEKPNRRPLLLAFLRAPGWTVIALLPAAAAVGHSDFPPPK